MKKRQIVHNYIYLVGLALLAFFMPLSEFFTSFCQFLLVSNFLIESNFKDKYTRLKNNKEVLIFIFLFLCSVIWCINTTNLQLAINDIVMKLPLLALPLVISTSQPLSKNKLNIVLIAFIAGVFFSSFLGFLAYHQIIMDVTPKNIRDMSPFISSIRLGLMCGLSVFIIAYWIKVKYFKNLAVKIFGLLLLFWFLFFIAKIEAFTAVTAMICVVFVFLIIWAYKEKRYKFKILKYIATLCFPIVILFYVLIQVYAFFTPTSIQNDSPTTKSGNKYSQNISSISRENGNFVYLDICDKELKENWNKYSKLDLHGKAHNGNEVYLTLLRYMTSKGLKKDAEGLAKLTKDDIINIENGDCNYRFVNKNGISRRIYEIILELNNYYHYRTVYDTSVAARIELQRAGLDMVKNNFWCGCGTGDIKECYNKYYETTLVRFNSDKYKILLTHNQYLSFFICYGIFGGIICLFAWFVPVFKKTRLKDVLFIVFFIMATMSMFADEMLVSSTAVAFISYFYSLFLWGEDSIRN